VLVRELFAKDLFRPINGVVKADQLDDRSVWQELDEYVVTKELRRHIGLFFDAYVDALQRKHDPETAGKIGAWISGFFGSGKSHFIKILSYLLANREVKANGQSRRAVEFFEAKIDDALLLGSIKRAVQAPTDVILFNIESKAEAKYGRDAILAVFLRVFNEHQGFSGDHPHIAHMERYLAQRGKFDRFKDAFRLAAGADWVAERDCYNFRRDEVVQALAQALGQTGESAAKFIDGEEKSFALNVENFAIWVREFLDAKGPDHRIIFLADEVGQFIGQDTHLMLSLQTITENLGTVCGGRAWVVVTSQEDIEGVIGEIKSARANDFSKIQGRFRTRVSLSSSNTDEVIQVRLLEKKDEVGAPLRAIHAQKRDILSHQISFKNLGMTLRSFRDGEDFVADYPFPPYQFQLMQKVFENIRRYGVTGAHIARGERSMLDAFQIAAKQIADSEIGVLVPLYRFYPAVEGFLEGTVKRTIEQAAENATLEPFDVLVLKTLFLIRHVEEVKGNADNVVTLCIDQIDADRIALKRQVEESLQRLEKETLIGRSGEDFFFLTNQERDVSRDIKAIDLNAGEEAKLLGDLVFNEVLALPAKHRYPLNGKDFHRNQLCDLHPVGGRHDGGLVVSVISPLADDYEFYNQAKCINQSTADNGQVLIRLRDDEALARELRACLKTDKYIGRRRDGSQTQEVEAILIRFGQENNDRRKRLKDILEKLVREADFYVAGRSFTPKATASQMAVIEALNYLIENTYTKLGYLKVIAADPRREIQAVLRANDAAQESLRLKGSEANPDAVQEIRSYLDLADRASKQVVLHDMVENRFTKHPYGWPDWEVILIVARLLVLGEISLVKDGDTLAVGKAYDALEKPLTWRHIALHKRRTAEPADIQGARNLGKELFAEIGPDTEDKLFQFLRSHLEVWRNNLDAYKKMADTGSYPGKDKIAIGLSLIGKLLAEKESYGFIRRLLDLQADVRGLGEDYATLNNFYESQRPVWEKARKAYGGFLVNEKELTKDDGAAKALRGLSDILASQEPFQHLKNVEGLIATIGTANEDVLSKRRDHALSIIDGHIETVRAELEAVQAEADLRNACLHRLQALRKQVEGQTSIAHIYQAQSEAEEARDAAFDTIEQAERKKVAAKPQPRPASEPATATQPPVKPAPQFRKPVVVQPASIARDLKKPYLETRQDIETFLDALRTRLQTLLDDEKRIEIR